jgi:UDP-glucose 4-epimerase
VKVLVTGATGLIGCHSVARLVAQRHAVRALVRSREKLARVLAPFPGAAAAVEAAEGDVTDPGSVDAALAGCEGVLHCAGLFSHERADAPLLRHVNVEGTRRVLGGAAAAGLRPIVHVSSMLALFPPPDDVLRADDPVTSPRGTYAATKAEAERVARALQAKGAPLTSVYPASVHGPHDPTVGSGPAFVADALRAGRVLVTGGGLAWTDVRDLAALLALPFAGTGLPPRILAPSFFLSHARLHALLCELTGRRLAARRLPAALLRGIGRLGDLGERWLGRRPALSHEAALVLTQSVPLDDSEARRRVGPPRSPEASFRDLLRWLHGAGVLEAHHVGRLAGSGGEDLLPGG